MLWWTNPSSWGFHIKRAVKWGIPTVVVPLIAVYGLISFLIASGVTNAERNDQDELPEAYGLQYENVEFLSRKGDVNLRGWYIPGQSERPTIIFVHGIGAPLVFQPTTSYIEATRLLEEGVRSL